MICGCFRQRKRCRRTGALISATASRERPPCSPPRTVSRDAKNSKNDRYGHHAGGPGRVEPPLLWLLCFAGLRDLRGLRANRGACGCLGAVGEPAGSRDAREAREETRRTAKLIDTGIAPADPGAPNHNSCGCCASVRDGPARLRANDPHAAPRRSRRDQTKRPHSRSTSITDAVPMPKRWDVTADNPELFAALIRKSTPFLLSSFSPCDLFQQTDDEHRERITRRR